MFHSAWNIKIAEIIVFFFSKKSYDLTVDSINCLFDENDLDKVFNL